MSAYPIAAGRPPGLIRPMLDVFAATGWGDALALTAGLAFPLAFAPFQIAPLAFVCLTLLFTAWRGVSARRAAWRGFLFGLGSFGVGTSWIYVSLHLFGGMPLPLAVLAVALFVAIFALFPALAGLLQAWPGGAPWWLRSVAVMPAAWVGCEWLRGWAFGGFPWLDAGYSQVGSWLAGLAPLVGVYGMGLSLALTSGAVLALLTAPCRAALLVAIVAAIYAAAWFGGCTAWTTPTGAPIPVALVQGNVPLVEKWAPGAAARLRAAYLAASRAHPGARLVVWPEAALPEFTDELKPAFWASVKRQHADFVFGALARDGPTPDASYYNAVVVVSGDTVGVYRKRHLVPFGEYLPFKRVFGWLLRYLDIPMSNFTAGAGDSSTLSAAGQPVGITVCFEDAFPRDVRRALPRATVLINISEDAWFGDSLAPFQRLQMAQLRAQEVGRPMLRAGNTGPSAIIDYDSTVAARTPAFRAAVLTGEVQPRRGATPFVRYGSMPVLAFAVLLWLTGFKPETTLPGPAPRETPPHR